MNREKLPKMFATVSFLSLLAASGCLWLFLSDKLNNPWSGYIEISYATMCGITFMIALAGIIISIFSKGKTFDLAVLSLVMGICILLSLFAAILFAPPHDHRPDYAKQTLGAFDTAQKQFYSKNHRYATTLKELDYMPLDYYRKSYAYFLTDTEVLQPSEGGPYRLPPGIRAFVSDKGFQIIAVSNLDEDEALDIWSINEKGELVNVVSDRRAKKMPNFK